MARLVHMGITIAMSPITTINMTMRRGMAIVTIMRVMMKMNTNVKIIAMVTKEEKILVSKAKTMELFSILFSLV
jgi:hypothetical protein